MKIQTGMKILIGLLVGINSASILAAHTVNADQLSAMLNETSASFDNYHSTTQLTPVTTSRGVPSVSLSSPSAFGGAGTVLFATLGYVNHWDGTDVQDGDAGLGVSFGDPYQYVGGLISTNIDSLGFNSDAFAQNGGVGFRINRYLDDATAVAVGMGTTVGWGAFSHIAHSYYAAVTHAFATPLPMSLNMGVGTGALYGGNDSVENKDNHYRPFAGVGFGLFKNFSLILDYTANEFTAGGNYSFVFWKLPFFVSASYANFARLNGAEPHMQLGAGVAYPI